MTPIAKSDDEKYMADIEQYDLLRQAWMASRKHERDIASVSFRIRTLTVMVLVLAIVMLILASLVLGW